MTGFSNTGIRPLRVALAFASFVLGLVLIGLWTTPVIAQQPEPLIDIGFQETAFAGEHIAIGAYLIDPAGNPVYDAEISFELAVEFMNVSDSVDLGTAITDENGLAMIEFEPRIQGFNGITARFAGNDVFAPIASTGQLEVESDGQVYREFKPYRIPGANMWLTAGLITVVWIVFTGSLGLIGWVNYKTRKEREGSSVQAFEP